MGEGGHNVWAAQRRGLTCKDAVDTPHQAAKLMKRGSERRVKGEAARCAAAVSTLAAPKGQASDKKAPLPFLSFHTIKGLAEVGSMYLAGGFVTSGTSINDLLDCPETGPQTTPPATKHREKG